MKLNQLTSAAATFSPNRLGLYCLYESVPDCFGWKGDPRRMRHLTSDTLPVPRGYRRGGPTATTDDSSRQSSGTND